MGRRGVRQSGTGEGQGGAAGGDRGLAYGHKVLVALRSGDRESTESWKGVLRDARQRGLRCPRVIIGDGHLEIWAALRDSYPHADEQRCWNHGIVDVLDQVPKRSQRAAKRFKR